MHADLRPTAVLICPGRGSYGKDELGCIGKFEKSPALTAALDAADAARRASGEPTVRELDGASAFKPSLHLQGRNAALLIYFATMAHAEGLARRHRILGVAGNSLGWYTALAVAGALSPTDGWRLVAEMARLQEAAAGGQVLTTTVGDDWRVDPARTAGVARALAEVNALSEAHFVAESIRLGGHAVLAGTELGVNELLRRLPQVKVGDRAFPFRLAGHGPFHTSLCADVAARARHELATLPITPPRVHLIDGFGRLHTPWSADPHELLTYTTGPQVTETFDFGASVRTAMRELCPDVLLCAGPGTSLRAPVGHTVVVEGYRGARDREAVIASGIVKA